MTFQPCRPSRITNWISLVAFLLAVGALLAAALQSERNWWKNHREGVTIKVGTLKFCFPDDLINVTGCYDLDQQIGDVEVFNSDVAAGGKTALSLTSAGGFFALAAAVIATLRIIGVVPHVFNMIGLIVGLISFVLSVGSWATYIALFKSNVSKNSDWGSVDPDWAWIVNVVGSGLCIVGTIPFGIEIPD